MSAAIVAGNADMGGSIGKCGKAERRRLNHDAFCVNATWPCQKTWPCVFTNLNPGDPVRILTQFHALTVRASFGKRTT